MHTKVSSFFRASSSIKLCASLATLSLLVWSLLAFDLHRLHEQTISFSRIQTQNLASAYSEDVETSIKASDYALMDLRDRWKNNPREFGAGLPARHIHLNPSIALGVSVIDANGALIFSSDTGKAWSIDHRTHEYFKVHRESRKDELFISQPSQGEITNRLVFQFTRPLAKSGEKFEGIIALSVPAEYFSRFHRPVGLGSNSAIALVRLNGEILSRSSDAEPVSNNSLKDAPFLRHPTLQAGFFQRHSEVDQIERLYSWQKLPHRQLVVLVGQASETVFAEYDRQRARYFLGGTIGSISFAVVGYFMLANRRQRSKDAKAIEEMEKALRHSQKLESVGKLTGGVAHDFNNILQIISGNVQMLQLIHSGHEQTEQRLDNVLVAVDRGATLSSQLLSFARRQPLMPRVVNIGKKLGKIEELLKPLVGEAIQIKTQVAEHLWNTLVDPSLMQNVILNLASNARDAMGGKGTLTIKLNNFRLDHEHVSEYPQMPLGEYVLFTVRDTGSGMTKEVIERAFEPFFTTKPDGVGTGLGLSMVYGFVKQSGGFIGIASEAGFGTKIRILLPRSIEPETTSPSIFGHSVTGGIETILVVEDDNQVRSTVGAMLTELGYRVLLTENAESALQVIEKDESVELLFTDVVMPGAIDGLELAEKAKSIRPGLTVLLTSGYLYDSVKKGRPLGKSTYLLKKPYKREQLDSTIRRLLSKKTS